jgi:hypothetical protein
MAFFPSSLGAIHTFASYHKVVHETPERQGAYVDNFNV